MQLASQFEEDHSEQDADSTVVTQQYFTGVCCVPCYRKRTWAFRYQLFEDPIHPASKVCAPDWREVDWSFWGNWLFVFGSLLYMITGIMVYYPTPGANLAAGFLNLIAALNYVVDALLYGLGWYVAKIYTTEEVAMESTAKSTNNTNSDVASSKFYIKKLPYWIVKADWTLWGTVFFFIGALGYLAQAVIGVYYPDNYDGSFIAGTFGALVFQLDSFIYIINWWLYKRDSQGTPDERFMLYSPNWKYVDWSGWGDWLFVIGSFLYIITNFLAQYGDDAAYEASNGLNVLAAAVFFVDPFLYFLSNYCEDRIEQLDEAV